MDQHFEYESYPGQNLYNPKIMNDSVQDRSRKEPMHTLRDYTNNLTIMQQVRDKHTTNVKGTLYLEKTKTGNNVKDGKRNAIIED